MKYQEYLTEHTISAESIQKFELTGDNLRLNIPVKDSEGKLCFMKQREFTGDKKFYMPRGIKTILFNSAILKANPEYLVVTAGEIDCIRLDQEGMFAVSGTGGEQAWKADWTNQIKPMKKIFLCLDEDETGIEATKKLFHELPHAKAIELPKGVKDTCEYFAHHKKADFEDLMKNALSEEDFIAKYPGATKERKATPRTDLKNLRFFHPALTIDRENQEVMVGIPITSPTFDKNDKYKLDEQIEIISSKNGVWTLLKEEMEVRNLYPTTMPSFGVTKSRWEGSHKKGSHTENEANRDPRDPRDPQRGGRVDPYNEVFLPIKATFEKFIDFSNPDYSTLLAVWVMGTYIFPIFEAFPYLYLGGIKGSGKTKVLEILYRLVFNPISSSNASPSSLFRSIENTLATILLDEGEALTGREANPDLRLLLNAGYKANGVVTRTNPETLKVEAFQVYSPKALASINLLDSTLAARCISLIMLRTANTNIGRARVNDRTLDGEQIRDSLYRWCLHHALEVARVFDDDENLSALNNRDNELYLPLFSIAAYLDKFNQSESILAIAQRAAEEGIQEDDTLDDWTLWVLEAIDQIVIDFRPYQVKDIRRTIQSARQEQSESLDEKMTHQWIGGCLKKFGFRRGKPTREGKTYLLKREAIDSLKQRYGLTPPPPYTGVTGVTIVTNEAKNDCDPISLVTLVAENNQNSTEQTESRDSILQESEASNAPPF